MAVAVVGEYIVDDVGYLLLQTVDKLGRVVRLVLYVA